MIVVDRFEGDYAVLETDSGMIDVEKSRLADDIGEGDVLFEKDGFYFKDSEATDSRRQEILKMMKKLSGGENR